MNLKPYKHVVHQPHTIKFPFLERNAFLIVIGLVVIVAAAAYYFRG